MMNPITKLRNDLYAAEAANFIQDRFKGFVPKQSRNLFQTTGLSRYETPIDSRITKWLNSL